jgi:hypothetical protein
MQAALCTLAYGVRSTAFIYGVISHVTKSTKGRDGVCFQAVAVQQCRNFQKNHTPLACFPLKTQINFCRTLLSRGWKKKLKYLPRQSTGTSAFDPTTYKDLDFIKRFSKNNEIAGRGVLDK